MNKLSLLILLWFSFDFEKKTKTIEDQAKKQTKTIEDQGEKQIKAIQDNKKEEKPTEYTDYFLDGLAKI